MKPIECNCGAGHPGWHSHHCPMAIRGFTPVEVDSRDPNWKTSNTVLDEPTGIDATLAERGKRYGEYRDHARITQSLKRIMRAEPAYDQKLTDDQRETLDMLAHKIGRILNGDPEYHDSWHDMVGYSKLSADEILLRELSRTAVAPKWKG